MVCNEQSKLKTDSYETGCFPSANNLNSMSSSMSFVKDQYHLADQYHSYSSSRGDSEGRQEFDSKYFHSYRPDSASETGLMSLNFDPDLCEMETLQSSITSSPGLFQMRATLNKKIGNLSESEDCHDLCSTSNSPTKLKPEVSIYASLSNQEHFQPACGPE